jgi:hypothetical protein
MALVAEDGREWYEVMPCRRPTAWVMQNVMPVLGKQPLSSERALSKSLSRFLNQFDEVHLIADWPEDIAHFCTALMPKPGYRFITPPLTMELVEAESTGDPLHNALADARELRRAVLGP